MSESIDPTQPSNTTALVRWFLLIGITFTVLAGSFMWISRSGAVDAAPDVSAGPAFDYPAPDFRLTSLAGKTLGPPDYQGKVVVIDFWATWCGPCKLQAEMLEKLHEELDPAQVQFLAVDIGEDAESVASYVAERPFPYPVLLDTEEELMMRYQILGLPTLMIVNKDGQVSFLRTGVTDVPTLRREIAKAGAQV